MKNKKSAPFFLRYSADLRSLVFLACLLVLLVMNWSGIFRSLWTYAATFPLAFIAAVIAHNHMHLGLFRGRRFNEIFSMLLSFFTGQPPTGIITAHNVRHHRHNNTDLDFTRCSLAPFRSNSLNVLLFPFFSIAAMFSEKESDMKKWRVKRPRLYRQALYERGFFYMGVLVLFILDWRATVIFLVTPWMFGQLCIVGIGLIQHQGCDRDSEFNHSRNVTGRVMNWLFLNNGFHTAHHIRPALHWSLLPEYHAEYIEPHIDFCLNHRTLSGAVWKRMLSNTEK